MNYDLDEQERDWVFTFGYGQHEGKHRHNFVRIRGTFIGAREEMVRRYGRAWSMQYEDEAEAGVQQFGLTEIK
jgi:hypothetical protein